MTSKLFEENVAKSIIDKSQSIIHEIQEIFDLPQGYLQTQLALHLPQFKKQDLLQNDLINKALIRSECLRLGSLIERRIEGLPGELKKNVKAQKQSSKVFHKNEKIVEKNLSGKETSIIFSEVNENIGNLIQSELHYLSNVRIDTIKHYGLFRQGESYPFAYVALSWLDRNYILQTLPFEAEMKEILVVTRLYNINNSPYNSTSLILSMIRKMIRQNYSEVKALVTSVNPNILFSGSSFKSSDFTIFALMPFVPLYYKGNYITRKTLDLLALSKNEKKFISKNKFKCLPVMQTVSAFSPNIGKIIKKRDVKKISLELYNR